MSKPFPFTVDYVTGAVPLTQAQADLIFTQEDIAKGQKRGQMKLFGPWQILVSYKALAISQDGWPNYENKWKGCHQTIHGLRTLTQCRESGYEQEGRVSVKGKKFRGFTSSQLFELPDGKLVDCAIIHVCDN